MAKFTFNDENVTNSYGFVVRTAGISLKRFNANPVMLEQHYNSTSAVLGRWANVKKEDALLTGEDDFDTEDPDAVKVKGKVDRGFIKGCSMGISFMRDDMKQRPDGVWELTKCELYEVSIVAIPSNANALRLYAADSGELLTEEQVKLSLSALSTEETPQLKTNMYKLNLAAATLVMLGLTSADNGIEVATAVEKLAARYDEEKKERASLQSKLDAIEKEQAKELLDEAQLSGKITATTRPEFEEMAKSNLALVKKVLAGLTGKKTLAGEVIETLAGEVKTEADFHKMPLDKQLAWKAANPDAYNAMFK